MTPEINLEAFWNLSYGLYVITSQLDGKFNGQIANTVIQVTAEPPRIAVSISKNNFTHDFISHSGTFAVSVLDESTPMTFIGLFGFKSGRDIDKLSQVSFKKGSTGCPLVLENALSVLEAKVIEQVDCGTHTLFVADVVGAEVLSKGHPLTYADYHLIKKGKTPKNAPTYRPPESVIKKERGEETMTKYKCSVCGYIYEPALGDPDNDIAPGTAFEALPDDWVCPICGAFKKDFEAED